MNPLETFGCRPAQPAEASLLAALHADGRGLSPAALPLTVLVFQALLESPLATLRVLVAEDRVVGFVLATSDRQRLLSDLLSRRPGALLARAVRHPRSTLQALGILRGGMRRRGATAEILEVTLQPPYRIQEAEDRLVAEAVEELRQRGADEVWVALDEQHPASWGALQANRFERVPEAAAVPGRWAAARRGLVPPVGRVPGPFGVGDRLRCALRLEMLVILPIYGLVLIPFASLLAWLGCRVDRRLGLPPVLPEPWNLAAMALLLGLGGLLLLWSYSYLILEGEGGPVPPFSAKTRRLVRTGPYAVVRHPSVLAKLIGACGLGCGFNSWTFLGAILPLLLAWSILWNGSRQDTDLVRVFGQEYLDYRRQTPMLVPGLRGRPR